MPPLQPPLVPSAHLGIGDLLDILPDAVVMVDAHSRIVYVNPAVRELLGHAPDDLLGQGLSLLVPPSLRDKHEAMVNRYRSDSEPRLMGARPVLHAQHASGRLVPVSISLCNQTLGDGQRVSVAVIHDVSAMKTRLDRATALAETDPLTGLGNRLRLSRRTQALLANARPFALLSVGLPGHAQLAQSVGQTNADEALRIAAERLQGRVHEGDVLVRLEGAQFVLMADGLTEPATLAARSDELAARVAQPMRVGEHLLELDVRVGTALSPAQGRSFAELLDAANRDQVPPGIR